MISWIQNHLIRHGRWIFITLLTVIIVAFVFTIGNTPGCTTNQSGYEKNMFYGYDLNSPLEMEDLAKKLNISSILNTGRPLQSQQQLNSALASRIARLHLADVIEIPVPSKDLLTRYIETRPLFRGPDGQFSRDAYTRFVDNIQSDPRIQQDLIVVVLEEDYRINQVEDVLSGPGYFLDSEALLQVQLNETLIKLSVAEINYSEFEPEITPSDDELMQFYTNNLQRYEIAERIQASYIKFPTDKYADQAEAFSEGDLRKHFIINRARFVAEYEAKRPNKKENDEEPSSADLTFEDVRSEVVADLTRNTTKKLANKAAQEFALTLYRNEIERNSPEFRTLLNENGLTRIEIPPYTIEEINDRGLSAEMLESGFALSEKRYFSDAYAIEDGFGVLILSERIPPEIPDYATIAESVKADYEVEKKRSLFDKEGKRIHDELSALVYAGVKFTQAAEALDLNVTTSEAFKFNDAPKEINRAALQRAQSMKERTVSQMITSADLGMFVFIEEKTVPEIDLNNEELAQTNDLLKQFTAYIRSTSLINELIAGGLEAKQTE